MQKKIIYLKTSWPENIGNAFIDMGSILSLKKATENNVVIYPISAFPIKLFADGPRGLRYKTLELVPPSARPFAQKLLGQRLEEKIRGRVEWKVNTATINNALDLVNVIEADYFVVSGMALTINFFNRFDEVLKRLKKRNVKIVFNGVGGYNYSKTEVEEISRKLIEIEPYCLISRDEIAFRNYKHLFKYSLDGIDCAFFVNELPHIQEAEIDLPEYVVFNFDSHDYLYKRLQSRYQTYMIIRTSHFFHRNPTARFYKANMLVSDSPYDYLMLYSHAREVHADRVHACVPTLSFSNPCRLYLRAAATALFEKIGADEITEKLVYPNITKIEREKEKQVEFLSSVIT